MNKDITIFFETANIEERCAESLYMDYLKEENKQLKDKIDKAIEYINGAYEMACYTQSVSLEQENIEDLLEILKGGNND